MAKKAAKATKANNKGNLDGPMVRTSAGLRDALFDEIDALRNGSSNAARARSVAMLSNSVLQSVTAEIEYHRYVADVSKGMIGAKLGVLELGSNIQLTDKATAKQP